MDQLPAKFLCSRKSRHQIGLDKAKRAMVNEVDIMNFIKSRRYFHMALRYLLPRQVREELKQLSHYVVIDPDGEEEGSTLQRMSTNHVKLNVS